MEIFKFNPSPSTPTLLESGEVVNGIKSKMWVERYRDPGEFVFEAPLSSGLEEVLPPGTLISHNDSLEVMIVENHEIDESKDKDSNIKVTGRSLDGYLDERVVGSNQNWASPPAILAEYELTANYTWNQSVTLINDHIYAPQTIDDNDALNSVLAATNVTVSSTIFGTPVSEARVVKRGYVLPRLLEILSINDLGIRSIRRNPFGVLGSATNTTLLVHAGTDKTSTVTFSWVHGDLDGAQYLRSIKSNKNAALVTGRYVETPVYLAGFNGYARRWMIIDASDLDDYLDVAPTGATRTAIINKMIIRGQNALYMQNPVNLARSDISKNSRYHYRKDYDIGDLITIKGNQGVTEIRRVVEYVEIEDENGESGHPTLAVIEL